MYCIQKRNLKATEKVGEIGKDVYIGDIPTGSNGIEYDFFCNDFWVGTFFTSNDTCKLVELVLPGGRERLFFNKTSLRNYMNRRRDGNILGLFRMAKNVRFCTEVFAEGQELERLIKAGLDVFEFTSSNEDEKYMIGLIMDEKFEVEKWM